MLRQTVVTRSRQKIQDQMMFLKPNPAEEGIPRDQSGKDSGL